MQDILLFDDNDLAIGPNGDFVVDFSDDQHIKLILESGRGDWRQNPQVGVNIRQLLSEDAAPTFLKHEVQKQLEADGATVNKVDVETGNMKIDARYTI